MAPRIKLRIANILMVLGAMPLMLGIAWIVGVISYARHHRGQMGGSDVFLMMGVLFVTYALAVLVSGVAALWSITVAKRNADLRSAVSTTIRVLVYIVLGAPPLCYLGITLWMR